MHKIKDSWPYLCTVRIALEEYNYKVIEVCDKISYFRLYVSNYRKSWKYEVILNLRDKHHTKFSIKN